MNTNFYAIVKAITPPIIIDIYKNIRKKHNYKIEEDKSQKMYRLSSGETYYSGKSIGEMWDEIGQLQFKFILENGLQPQNRFLDIGCGSLRGGVHFIKYLHSGNYYGIDKEQWLLNAAIEVEIPRYGLSDKNVHLLKRDDFDFSVFGMSFDYAIAQSVFTHLTWNSIYRCLVNVEKVLKDDGKFFATFFEDKKGDHHTRFITHTPGGTITYPDKDPFHYEFNIFQELAKKVSLNVEYIGEWNHPRNQMMIVFRKNLP
ncbi:MAG: class I SAM-dependent methyltransferase [Spirochaetes bacterium]|nr:class I SAM-dependent methyltransferase [Spirochaetota bacterium]